MRQSVNAVEALTRITNLTAEVAGLVRELEAVELSSAVFRQPEMNDMARAMREAGDSLVDWSVIVRQGIRSRMETECIVHGLPPGGKAIRPPTDYPHP